MTPPRAALPGRTWTEGLPAVRWALQHDAELQASLVPLLVAVTDRAVAATAEAAQQGGGEPGASDAAFQAGQTVLSGFLLLISTEMKTALAACVQQGGAAAERLLRRAAGWVLGLARVPRAALQRPEQQWEGLNYWAVQVLHMLCRLVQQSAAGAGESEDGSEASRCISLSAVTGPGSTRTAGLAACSRAAEAAVHLLGMAVQAATGSLPGSSSLAWAKEGLSDEGPEGFLMFVSEACLAFCLATAQLARRDAAAVLEPESEAEEGSGVAGADDGGSTGAQAAPEAEPVTSQAVRHMRRLHTVLCSLAHLCSSAFAGRLPGGLAINLGGTLDDTFRGALNVSAAKHSQQEWSEAAMR